MFNVTEKGLFGTPPAPARMWVLLASEASTAVIFRRGPSRWTRLYLWNTRTDEITPGSWFAGRLYELLSDLSPDGKHLAYFARNESKRRQEEAKISLGTESFSSWTALCRPPRVKALGLWNASDDWGGGAVFAGNAKIWLSGQNSEPETLIEPKGFAIQVAAGAHFPLIYLISMQRNGWRNSDPDRTEVVALWKYPMTVQKSKLELRLSISAKRQIVKEYVWHGPQPVPGLEDASWADIDQQGRLIYAREGRLYAFVKDCEIEIADLNLDQPPGRPEEKPTD